MTQDNSDNPNTPYLFRLASGVDVVATIMPEPNGHEPLPIPIKTVTLRRPRMLNYNQAPDGRLQYRLLPFFLVMDHEIDALPINLDAIVGVLPLSQLDAQLLELYMKDTTPIVLPDSTVGVAPPGAVPPFRKFN